MSRDAPGPCVPPPRGRAYTYIFIVAYPRTKGQEEFALIEVKHLVKRFDGRCAVDDLSFTVEDGQICGFLGPNGAGKSTTMNIMTGYLAPSEGSVAIEGHDILTEPEAARRCVGYLPEQPPLYGEMTVEEYLEFVAELKRVPAEARQAQLDRVLGMTHLSDVSGRLIRNLSKGYRQRVGLAQAILGFPKILILDEPTVGLDPKQILEIRELIRSLAKEHTVLLSSHILSEVQEICDRIMIIHRGKLLAAGTPDELETMLRGGSELALTVRGTAEQAARVLRGVAGLTEQTLTEGDGKTEIRLLYDPASDPREELFYAFAEERCPIVMMKSADTSLEQVFLELTSDAYEGAPLVAGADAPAAEDASGTPEAEEGGDRA